MKHQYVQQPMQQPMQQPVQRQTSPAQGATQTVGYQHVPQPSVPQVPQYQVTQPHPAPHSAQPPALPSASYRSEPGKPLPNAAPPNGQQHSESTTTTITQTLTYNHCDAGGETRKAADAKGQGQQFEQRVQTLISSMAVCPSNFRWYCMKLGYLCADGNHLMKHSEVDKAMREKNHVPKVNVVNTLQDPDLWDAKLNVYAAKPVHPPQIDFWQPMHHFHDSFIREATAAGFRTPTQALYDQMGMDAKRPDEDEHCRCQEKLGFPEIDSLAYAGYTEPPRHAYQSDRSGGRARMPMDEMCRSLSRMAGSGGIFNMGMSPNDADMGGRHARLNGRHARLNMLVSQEDEDAFDEFSRY